MREITLLGYIWFCYLGQCIQGCRQRGPGVPVTSPRKTKQSKKNQSRKNSRLRGWLHGILLCIFLQNIWMFRREGWGDKSPILPSHWRLTALIQDPPPPQWKILPTRLSLLRQGQFLLVIGHRLERPEFWKQWRHSKRLFYTIPSNSEFCMIHAVPKTAGSSNHAM